MKGKKKKLKDEFKEFRNNDKSAYTPFLISNTDYFII